MMIVKTEDTSIFIFDQLFCAFANCHSYENFILVLAKRMYSNKVQITEKILHATNDTTLNILLTLFFFCFFPFLEYIFIRRELLTFFFFFFFSSSIFLFVRNLWFNPSLLKKARYWSHTGNNNIIPYAEHLASVGTHMLDR